MIHTFKWRLKLNLGSWNTPIPGTLVWLYNDRSAFSIVNNIIYIIYRYHASYSMRACSSKILMRIFFIRSLEEYLFIKLCSLTSVLCRSYWRNSYDDDVIDVFIYCFRLLSLLISSKHTINIGKIICACYMRHSCTYISKRHNQHSFISPLES